MPQRFPLEMIEVQRPCEANWEAMAGDDRTRYCAHCKRVVHNLSAMTRREAEQTVCDLAGELCVLFSRARNGDVVTLDYASRQQLKRRHGFWGLLVGSVGVIFAMIGCRPTMMTTTMGTPCRPATRPTVNSTTNASTANGSNSDELDPPRVEGPTN
jgi:hypothetical protein